jgi:predicted RNA-binding protein
VETKVKQLTQKELIKQQSELKQIVDQRTNNLRAYVENQLRSSQMTMATLRGDLKQQIAISQ